MCSYLSVLIRTDSHTVDLIEIHGNQFLIVKPYTAWRFSNFCVEVPGKLFMAERKVCIIESIQYKFATLFDILCPTSHLKSISCNKYWRGFSDLRSQLGLASSLIIVIPIEASLQASMGSRYNIWGPWLFWTKEAFRKITRLKCLVFVLIREVGGIIKTFDTKQSSRTSCLALSNIYCLCKWCNVLINCCQWISSTLQ